MRKLTQLFSLTVLLLTSSFSNLYSQATGTNFNPGGYYLGYSNAGFDLNFTMTGSQYMQLNNTTNAGHVGIGLTFTPGNDVLDLLPDVNFPNTGLGINNQTVLHNWGNRNMFTGVGTGASLTGGTDNIFNGWNAGTTNAAGSRNTFIGSEAGTTNAGGSNNAFVGYRSGRFTTAGNNAFFGALSGQTNSIGTSNAFFGNSAGTANTTGSFNVFAGDLAGQGNIAGDNNVFMGDRAGSTYNGDANVLIGFNSGILTTAGGQTFLGHRTGWNTTAGANNTFIGFESGFAVTNAAGNSFLGFHTGLANTAANNTFVGMESELVNTASTGLTFVGFHTGLANTGANNTFIGFESGLANVASAGNTFVGYHTGLANTAANNTFVGMEAGLTNVGGARNTFIGYHAGFVNNNDDNTFNGFNAGVACTGQQNTFIGSLAGLNTVLRNNCTYVGYQSGTVANAINNTMVGSNSGLRNTNGIQNTFMGQGCGNQITAGSNNSYYGWQTGPSLSTAPCPTLDNSAAFGANADVRNSNQMILGDNNVNVGIGLSGDVAGPQNKLEINANGAYVSTTPFSGLRLTDMRSGSSTTTNPNHVVLSVNATGDVILVPDDGGGNLTECGGGLAINYINKTTAAHTVCNSEIYETTATGVGTTKVGIGVGATPTAKLDVFNNYTNTLTNFGITTTSIAGANAAHAYGLYAVATGNQGYSKAIVALANAPATSGTAYGVDIQTNTSASTSSFGIRNLVSGTGAGTGYLSTVTGVAGAASTGADITVGTGNYITGLAINANNGTINNIGVAVGGTTSSATTYNEGYSALMDGGVNCYGYSCDITNNYSSTAANIGFRAAVNGTTANTVNDGANLRVASNGANRGVYALVGPGSPASTGDNWGGYFESMNSNSTNVGVNAVARVYSNNSSINIGLLAQGGGYSSVTNTDSYGIKSIAGGGSNLNYGISAYGGGSFSTLANSNIGGKFYASGNTSNYGVYSVTTTSGCGTTGTFTTTSSPCASAAGYFSGAVFASEGYFVPSDQNLKINVLDIQNALATINLLQPKSYQYDTTQFPFMNLSVGD